MATQLVFYNVENLFDILDDPFTNDNAYLPTSAKSWEEKRYIRKLLNLSKVLTAIEEPCPGLIALAEIENQKVVRDLITAMNLDEEQLGWVHVDSPDERGMDVGLIYRKDVFELKSYKVIPIVFESDPADKTRDVLVAELIDHTGDELVCMVCHWPSRKEGQKASQIKRFETAQLIREAIEKQLSTHKQTRILLMGDLNCTPNSPPVYRLLDQRGHADNPLINLSWSVHKNKKGSTNYRGKWLMFDQMLISPSLEQSICNFEVVAFPWMLFYNPKYKDFRPNKTYAGKNYIGGFSDHLPVKVTYHNLP